MRLGPFTIFRSVDGDIGPGRSWICWHRIWMYNGDTLPRLLLDVWRNWKNDSSMVG